MRCPSCGQYTSPSAPMPGQAAQQAAFLEDRNRNGIPDVFEGPAGMMGNPYMPPAGAAMGTPYFGSPLDPNNVPPAPREPSPRARDLVYGYQGAQNVKMWIGVVFFLMGSVMSTIFCWGLPADMLIGLFGTSVQGTVSGTEIQTSISVNHRHPQLVRYTFRMGGASYEGSSSTLNYTPGQPKAGTPIAIEVLSAAPSFSRAAGTTSSAFGYGTLFVLIFPLVGGLLAFTTIRENRREIRAFRLGKPIIAQVTFQGLDRSTKSNGRHPYKIDWQFLVGPTVYKGSISHMERNAISDLAVGNQILVLYDPGRPATNTVYVA
ncbi:MAG: hypothetical protein U0359_20930 [Byssovorax sp.]